VSEVLNLVGEGYGIEDHDTRMKYVRLIQKLDRTEIAFYSRKSKK
jgi:hypothetical protein